MRNTKKLTYISLFSSAGIGCYGFKQNGFQCVATCELLNKRLEIQKINNKCKYESGYINEDISSPFFMERLKLELKKWNIDNNLDVIIATPPCQGMSVANQKKNNEIKRNSLVVNAINIIKSINPRIFIFENVSMFLKTNCVGVDNKTRTIGEEIDLNLAPNYLINSKVLNFKNYGGNSSRTRTIVIGVRKDNLNEITPFEIFPDYIKEKTLREVIGDLPSLKNMGEHDENNVLHNFKKYDLRMVNWIKNLKEGESAFENKNTNKIPHHIRDGKIIHYKKGFGDKYKRQVWDRPGPCIHTANDCLASQNTVHPSDDRVFSIYELMLLMSIPIDFKWDYKCLDELSYDDSKQWLAKNEGNIRKCIGEAVPTKIFYNIAKKIKTVLHNDDSDFFKISNKFEKRNLDRKKNAAFYTSRINLAYTYYLLPDFKKKEIKILEPSVGIGNFLLPIIKKYENYNKVDIWVNDIDSVAIKNLKKIIYKMNLTKNFSFHFINSDFKKYKSKIRFDLIVGNPPFKENKNKKISFKNDFEIFWFCALKMSDKVIFVNPKYILNSPAYNDFRSSIAKQNITDIIDFGEKGFSDVKIETIVMKIDNSNSNNFFTKVYSVTNDIKLTQSKKYIFSDDLPCWVIFRDEKFDKVFNKIKKNIFNIKKNYEISNSFLSDKKNSKNIWVLRSKNINYDKPEIRNIEKYDRYIDRDLAVATKFYKYIQSSKQKLYLIPTLTYYPRIIEKPKDIFVNGSILVAELKDPHFVLTDNDINYFYTKEFRDFYSIAFNYSVRTLNIDSNTIKFFGVVR